jgi:hypothetical protein
MKIRPKYRIAFVKPHSSQAQYIGRFTLFVGDEISLYTKHKENTHSEVGTMGRIDKGEKCNVSGCSETAIRSVSNDRAAQAKLDTKGAHRAYLCKNHYKEFKKKLKKDDRLEKWRRDV